MDARKRKTKTKATQSPLFFKWHNFLCISSFKMLSIIQRSRCSLAYTNSYFSISLSRDVFIQSTRFMWIQCSSFKTHKWFRWFLHSTDDLWISFKHFGVLSAWSFQCLKWDAFFLFYDALKNSQKFTLALNG